MLLLHLLSRRLDYHQSICKMYILNTCSLNLFPQELIKYAQHCIWGRRTLNLFQTLPITISGGVCNLSVDKLFVKLKQLDCSKLLYFLLFFYDWEWFYFIVFRKSRFLASGRFYNILRCMQWWSFLVKFFYLLKSKVELPSINIQHPSDDCEYYHR